MERRKDLWNDPQGEHLVVRTIQQSSGQRDPAAAALGTLHGTRDAA
jgi:hypothetical protein